MLRMEKGMKPAVWVPKMIDHRASSRTNFHSNSILNSKFEIQSPTYVTNFGREFVG